MNVAPSQPLLQVSQAPLYIDNLEEPDFLKLSKTSINLLMKRYLGKSW